MENSPGFLGEVDDGVHNGSRSVVLPETCYDNHIRRGESENRNKELKNGLAGDRLSCHRFMANYFLLQLHCAALNLLIRLRPVIADPPTLAALRGSAQAPTCPCDSPAFSFGGNASSPCAPTDPEDTSVTCPSGFRGYDDSETGDTILEDRPIRRSPTECDVWTASDEGRHGVFARPT
ncbi:MAG: transposase [Phycisphaerae bacterium]